MIERTFDYRVVKKMVDWNIIVSRDVLYLIYDGIGLFTLHEFEDGLMIHADMSKKCRGKIAIQGIKEAFNWLVENTGVRNIYAEIPEDNKPSWYMAKFCGMELTQTIDNFRCYKMVLRGDI